ncbi:NADP-dependent oxidoreductase domain-containing protein [Rhodocollybia butyracea]|uniref:NADP-dependent oxidoreductase domain-containing protein n=1 Tax=Rhodocollybia butyracea TaxID=206335 RepID=A0A9P5Q4M2_9AGAR|nr:NADP-dependent oxidoreductase domain-containing protein [Rhodocollybia butyracea]
MSPTVQTIELKSGVKVPWLAWGNGSGDARKVPIEAGLAALKAGIRHIDTAQAYKNEEATGEVLTKSASRKIRSLLPLSVLSGGILVEGGKTVPLDQVRPAIQESIKKLGFIPDLFLIHTPFTVDLTDLKKTWQILEEMKAAGELKEIDYKPAVNQLEYHPYLLAHLEPVLAIQEKHGIITESFRTFDSSNSSSHWWTT